MAAFGKPLLPVSLPRSKHLPFDAHSCRRQVFLVGKGRIPATKLAKATPFGMVPAIVRGASSLAKAQVRRELSL